LDREAQLLEIVGALRALSGGPGRLHRRQKQAEQYPNDRDYDQQFDQRKRKALTFAHCPELVERQLNQREATYAVVA
jgi:hypothetical protein